MDEVFENEFGRSGEVGEDGEPPEIFARPQRPGDVVNLDRVRTTPAVLTAILVRLAVASLALGFPI